MDEAPLLLDTTGPIAHMILNAPPKNEMNRQFFVAFLDIVRNELPALDTQGLIVYGCGRHFSSGANIEEVKRTEIVDLGPALQRGVLHTSLTFQALATLPFPVVAAVSGCCFGSALELALACRYRLASRNAVFAAPESSFDLMPGCGGTLRLRQCVGTGKAIELILSGRSVSAEEAHRIGLIDSVIDKDELLAAAERLVERVGRS